MKEIQVIKIPDSPDKLDWEVCHISVERNYSSYSGCSNRKSTKHGVNQVKLPNTNNYTDVYCDQTTNGGGWTVGFNDISFILC
ncbi:hypothetical protein LSH36_606g02006 [Paralvinella palmiformis]|uniref:Fibrinogen C-terminal domain-containing protein n=1 Tax=Paralvinella palmiformis TaxID=53620 RepID=A0AAD9J5F2_9ANNE|nr:hypothetical protein LSH36_606g02006 [Paralvinella palmiformis]